MSARGGCRRPGRRPAFLAASLALAIAGSARGQEDPDLVRRLQRQLRELDTSFRLTVPADQPIAERLLFDYGGSVRFALLGVDSEAGNTRVLRQTDATLYLQAELDGAHRFFGRLRFLYNDFNSGDSFDGRGDGLDEPIADRYWYQFDLRGAHLAETGERLGWNLDVRAGRQYVSWGAGLALADVLYAGRVDLEFGDVALRGLVGLTPATGTIDFDGSRPGFDSDTERAFFGASLEYRGFARHRPYVSFLVQRDHNDRDFAVISTPIGGFPTRFDYDSEYVAIGSTGTILSQVRYRAEFVYETGKGLSSPFDAATGLPVTQTREDVEAWAALGELTYLFNDERESRVDLGFAIASGDRDRIDSANTFGGNAAGTTDRAFNGLGYVNTGLALAPDISNLLSIRLGYSTSPLRTGGRGRWLRAGVTGFLFTKVNQSAAMNVSTVDKTFVGGEVDLMLDWRITSDVSVGLRYGVFIPGEAIPDDEDDVRHFVYAGVTYAF